MGSVEVLRVRCVLKEEWYEVAYLVFDVADRCEKYQLVL